MYCTYPETLPGRDEKEQQQRRRGGPDHGSGSGFTPYFDTLTSKVVVTPATGDAQAVVSLPANRHYFDLQSLIMHYSLCLCPHRQPIALT